MTNTNYLPVSKYEDLVPNQPDIGTEGVPMDGANCKEDTPN